MFSIGNSVIHPGEGVCEITDICSRTFDGKTCDYYVLKTVYDSRTTLYIPVETAGYRPKIRLLLNEDQIHEAIDLIKDSLPIISENDNKRRTTFKEIIASGEPTDISRVLKTVYELKCSTKGKKQKISDERIIRETETSVFSEFGYVLGIKQDEMPSYIKNRLSENP